MSATATTITRFQPIYDRNNHRKEVGSMATQTSDNQLRPELTKVVEDIIGLRQLAATTGFLTFKTQREILNRLSPEDMAAVGRALAKIEQQKK